MNSRKHPRRFASNDHRQIMLPDACVWSGNVFVLRKPIPESLRRSSQTNAALRYVNGAKESNAVSYSRMFIVAAFEMMRRSNSQTV